MFMPTIFLYVGGDGMLGAVNNAQIPILLNICQPDDIRFIIQENGR